VSGSTSAHCSDAPAGGAHAAGSGTGALHKTAPRSPEPGSAPVPVPPSHHGYSLERWPLRNAILLGALEGAVPSARVHVRQLLWEWGRAELGEDGGVVVSELVTNAVVASAGLRPTVAPVLVWLGSDTRCVLVAVADVSPQPPMRLDPGPDVERGRGLALVEAFSSRWGWHRTTVAGLMKVVWAEWHPESRTDQQSATARPNR
jgi:anti-sigma regulatory factor (Ser/Thr protein kinase)